MTTTAAPTVSPSAMHDRVPAQSLIEQVLLHQAVTRPRTRIERVLGRDPLDAEARSWYTGAMGERAVAGRLATLPAGWFVLHSLPVGRGGADIDHLIVGPGGVFTVNTKHHVDASVWVAGRTVLVAGSRTSMVVKAEAEARRVDRIVASVLPDGPAARAVIAIVGAKRLTVRRAPRTVAVLRAEHIRRFLRTQPRRLSPADVSALVTVFDEPRTWQPASEATPELLLAFARVAREVRGAARVRVTWAVGAIGFTGAASAAILLPGVAALLSGG